MSQHIGPRTISAIGGSIKRVGNYRIHTFPSELVTDGLVMNLDAGDPRSLDLPNLNMTTWTDLSGNGNNGTLTNGPTYSNANGGSIVFDGSNDFVNFSSAPNTESTGYTISAWFRATSFGTNAQGLVSYGNETNYQRRSLFLWDAGLGSVKLTSSAYTSNILASTTLALNTWYYGVVTVSSTGETKIYLNGVLDGSGTHTLVSPTSNTLYVGRTGSGEYFNGRIPIVHIYNRVLSAAEVAQNYDALKVRYTSYTNTFTPLCGGGSGKVEVLCVAGGGGGGANHGGGGGGAGGLIYNSAFSVTSNSPISLSVGSGGTQQNNGNNSTFSSLTAIGGGAGATEGGADGNAGGSGGGGSGYATTTNGGSGTSGQGYSGGKGGFPNTNNTLYGHGGGGGGAGGAGTDGTEGAEGNNVGTAGIGGAGLSYSISGTSQFYAGGGGGGYWGSAMFGGAGGSGIGGRGGEGAGNPGGYKGKNAIPNTGSGGGGSAGSGFPREGGNGSNGIVIVRYPASDYNVELLIVGGGGGGGGASGTSGAGPRGGGGAGGVLYYSSYPVSSGTKYSVIVGKGGIGGTFSGVLQLSGDSGDNSQFGQLIAFGGGFGAGYDGKGTAVFPSSAATAGGNGGSGGSGQGNAGGIAPSSIGNAGAGGGGGASEQGKDAVIADGGGAGGNGLAYTISGTSTYYGGGGGSGIYPATSTTYYDGGLGGGGNGARGNAGPAQSGVSNTGGGGGGAGANQASGGNGGSGVIIIAYRGPQRGIGGTVDTTSRPGYTLHRFTATGTDFFIP
jgi:hypothetical protein